MNNNWRTNKQKAVYNNRRPTLADQAAARDTDINVIVRNYAVHGQLPLPRGTPLTGDFTQLPTDLRGFIDLARSTKLLRTQLPKQLQHLSNDQLLLLTPDQILKMITPPDKQTDRQTDKPKEEAPK
jgi:hypothetical protein